LIESLLLGIPIPSIFVFEKENGSWELIDGLQRVSTILEFMEKLRNPGGGLDPPSILEATNIFHLSTMLYGSPQTLLRMSRATNNME
jgi:hypothetical protein